MDYSLLLCIENGSDTGAKDEDYEVDLSRKHRFAYDNKIYHIAIIDYIQEWNLKKQAERFYKTMIRRVDGNELSAMEPEQYADRFLKFMEVKVFN